MTDFRFAADHAIRKAIRSGKDELVQQQGEIVREYLNAYLNHDARAAHAVKGVVKNVHEAAAPHAKHAAVGAGTVAFITNLVACLQGEKTPVQAAQDTGKSTALAAAFAYVTTAVSTAITGAMRNSGSDYVKSLGAAGIMPAVMNSAADTVKLVNALALGQISQESFMDELVDHNIGALGNLYGAAIAQAGAHALSLGAGAQFAAGMVGGTLGYQLAMATYTILKESAKDYQHAKEERIRIERECAEVVELITRYRTQLSHNVSQYMGERLSVFNEAMVAMDAALVANDPDGFLAANADIQRILHHDAQFRSQQEFDEFMDSNDPLVL